MLLATTNGAEVVSMDRIQISIMPPPMKVGPLVPVAEVKTGNMQYLAPWPKGTVVIIDTTSNSQLGSGFRTEYAGNHDSFVTACHVVEHMNKLGWTYWNDEKSKDVNRFALMSAKSVGTEPWLIVTLDEPQMLAMSRPDEGDFIVLAVLPKVWSVLEVAKLEMVSMKKWSTVTVPTSELKKGVAKATKSSSTCTLYDPTRDAKYKFDPTYKYMHSCSTSAGCSGMPVFMGTKVVAIHLGGFQETQMNYCVSVGPLLFNSKKFSALASLEGALREPTRERGGDPNTSYSSQEDETERWVRRQELDEERQEWEDERRRVMDDESYDVRGIEREEELPEGEIYTAFGDLSYLSRGGKTSLALGPPRRDVPLREMEFRTNRKPKKRTRGFAAVEESSVSVPKVFVKNEPAPKTERAKIPAPFPKPPRPQLPPIQEVKRSSESQQESQSKRKAFPTDEEGARARAIELVRSLVNEVQPTIPQSYKGKEAAELDEGTPGVKSDFQKGKRVQFQIGSVVPFQAGVSGAVPETALQTVKALTPQECQTIASAVAEACINAMKQPGTNLLPVKENGVKTSPFAVSQPSAGQPTNEASQKRRKSRKHASQKSSKKAAKASSAGPNAVPEQKLNPSDSKLTELSTQIARLQSELQKLSTKSQTDTRKGNPTSSSGSTPQTSAP
jgi:hypothetical protein